MKSEKKAKKTPLTAQMPSLVLGDAERVIKVYKCGGEIEGVGSRKAAETSTGITVTSKRLIKTQEFIDGKKFRSFVVEQILLDDIKSIFHGKSVGIRRNLAMFIFGIILCPVLIGIFMVLAYVKKKSDVARWLTIYAKSENPVFTFGEKTIFKRNGKQKEQTNIVTINLHEDIEHLGDELLPIIFDIEELGADKAADKWAGTEK